MSPVSRREAKKPARRIRTRRDYAAASHVAKKLATQSERDALAERRLQSLLHELERFDGSDEEPDEGSDEELDPGLRRRWSDDDIPGSE